MRMRRVARRAQLGSNAAYSSLFSLCFYSSWWCLSVWAWVCLVSVTKVFYQLIMRLFSPFFSRSLYKWGYFAFMRLWFSHFIVYSSSSFTFTFFKHSPPRGAQPDSLVAISLGNAPHQAAQECHHGFERWIRALKWSKSIQNDLPYLPLVSVSSHVIQTFASRATARNTTCAQHCTPTGKPPNLMLLVTSDRRLGGIR